MLAFMLRCYAINDINDIWCVGVSDGQLVCGETDRPTTLNCKDWFLSHFTDILRLNGSHI